MKVSGTGFNSDGNREMADDHRRNRANGTADTATAAGGSGGSGGNYDVFNDEIKVYKYEGEQEPPASETLSEDKRVLVTDVEENMKQSEEESSEDKTHLNGILENPFSRGLSSFSSFIPPYPYPGCSGPFGLGAVSVPHPGFPFYNDFFAQPPPAHMGFPSWSLATPPGFCSPTSMYGLPGQASPFYGLSATHQGPPIYPPSTFYPTGFSPVHTWPHGSGYPFSCFPQLSKFQPSSMLGSHLGFSYPGISHPALVSSLSQSNGAESPLGFRSSTGNSTSKKLDPSKSTANSSNSSNNTNNNKINSIHSGLHHPFAFNPQLRHHHHHHPDHVLHLQSHPQVSLPQRSEFVTSPRGSSRSPLLTSSSSSSSSTNKVPHIKKPLNAFMLFMKEMRQKVIDECTLKESSAINQILGRKWHSLDRSEQTKYYDMARREKELHRQLYPSWTARDNYAIHARKKRRKEMMRDDDKAGDAEDRNAIDCMNAKKCRARYGVEQQYKWCKPCRRKKRCIRFMHDNNSDPFEENEDENSSTSTRLNVPRGNNSNPSAADSTTEIFSPTPSTNADDSRNRCKVAQPLEDGVRPGQPVDRPQHNKQSYPSVANHVQLNLNALQSDFSTSSSTAASAVVVCQKSATLQTTMISSHEYLQRSTPNRIPCREMAPFFASTTTTSNQSAGRCSHYCQQPSTRHEGQSQMGASVSFPDVPSPDVATFSADEGMGKVKIQEGRLQQAATIF